MIFLGIIFGLGITTFIYILFPILYKAHKGKVHFSKALLLSTINSAVCSIICYLIIIFGADTRKSDTNYLPVFIFLFTIYSLVDLAILKKKNNKEETVQSNNDSQSDTINEETKSSDNTITIKKISNENYEEKAGILNSGVVLKNRETITESKNNTTKRSEIMIDINEQQLENKIAKLQNHGFLPKNITFTYKNLATNRKLQAINAYEGSAQALYEQGCKYFGFDKEKKGYFRPLQPLYAKLVTPAPEYYSVWFLAHSDINNSTNGTWYNFYEGDTLLQCEIDTTSPTHNKPRITFIKQESGDYVFIGIYQFVKDHFWYSDAKRYYVQAYTKISDTYPESK